jgi:hypothetical protein
MRKTNIDYPVKFIPGLNYLYKSKYNSLENSTIVLKWQCNNTGKHEPKRIDKRRGHRTEETTNNKTANRRQVGKKTNLNRKMQRIG